MADLEGKKEQPMYSGKDTYKNIIRKDGQTWEADKYARLGVYTYLLNRMLGKPARWGLDNEDVSFQFKDVLKKRFDEIVKEYMPDKVGMIDLTDPKQKSQFFAEMDEYSEHCQAINPNKTVPSIAEMENFLNAVCDDKNSFYMDIHKSVQEKSGEYTDDEGRKMKSLIAERNLKNRQIDDAVYALKRDNFWTGLKGAGVLGSGGAAIGGVAAFFLPFPLGLIVGGAGLIGGGLGLRSFVPSFMAAVRENIKKRQQLRDLKKRGGAKGKRGLKEIEDQIKYNRGLLKIMDSVHKIKADGSMPTLDEFIEYIKKSDPFVYERIKSGRYEGNFKKLWRQSKGHYYSNSGGELRKVMGYMTEHAVTEVTKNDEIGIERQDVYNAVFAQNGGIKALDTDENGKVKKGPDGKILYTENAMTLDEWVTFNDKFVGDKDAFKKMEREYIDLKRKASISGYNVFMDAIFNQAYEPNSAQRYANILGENGNKNLKEALQNHPEGGKLQILQNAINFLNIESKMDGDLRLDGSLGVSVKAQLVTDDDFENAVNDGCKQLFAKLKKLDKDAGRTIDYTSQEAEASGLVNDVQLALSRHATKAELDTYVDKVNTSSVPSNVKHYLKKMIERKQAEAPMSTAEIVAKMDVADIDKLTADPAFDRTEFENIKIGISKCRDLKSYEEIYSKINSLTCTYEAGDEKPLTKALNRVKSQLFSALNESKVAFDNKEKMESRAGVLEAIEHGRFNASEDMSKLFEEITKINYEYFKTNYNDIVKFYTGTVLKSSSNELRDYLKMRLANKLVLEISTALRNPSLYKDNVDQLRQDLMRIKSCPFLSPSQVKQLEEGTSDAASPSQNSNLNENGFNYHISIALKAEVKEMQRDLFNPEKKYGEKINIYLNHDLKEGGFKEQLAEGYLHKELGAKYEAYQMISRNRESLFKFSYAGFSTNLNSDLKSPESKLITSLLTSPTGKYEDFDENSKSNITKIIGFSNKLKTTVSSIASMDILTFAKDPSKLAGQIKFEHVKEFDKTIDAEGKEVYNYQLNSAEDCRIRLAELILYKRQIVAIVKGQMRQLREKFGSEITQQKLVDDENLRKAYEAIVNTWRGELSRIDSLVGDTKRKGLEFGFDFDNEYDTHDCYIESASSAAGKFLDMTNAYARANEETTVLNAEGLSM